jgi:murein DD-endopeptidase MepM/ murein hydrolase activator NlpD
MTSMTMCFTVITAAALLAAAPGPAGSGAPGAGAVPGAVPAVPAVSAAAAGAAGAGAGCAGPPGPDRRCWPVTGFGPRGRPVVLRGLDPPPAPWGAGHRGADLRAGPAAPVRAAAAGELVFAGRIAGTDVIVLRLPSGLRTTYEPARADLPVGARVTAGERVGALSGPLPHCPGPCLHWGLLRGDTYLDPLSLLPPALRRAGPSRLLPVYGAGAVRG